MMKWEYEIEFVPDSMEDVSSDGEEVLSYLNEMGDKGWELVSVSNGIAYFKRQTQ